TVIPKPLKIFATTSWVRGRSLGASRRNMPMTTPMLFSTWMTKTFFSLPTKIAQPLFAGRIPRISTGTTSLFIPSVYGGAHKRQAACVRAVQSGKTRNKTANSNHQDAANLQLQALEPRTLGEVA